LKILKVPKTFIFFKKISISFQFFQKSQSLKNFQLLPNFLHFSKHQEGLKRCNNQVREPPENVSKRWDFRKTVFLHICSLLLNDSKEHSQRGINKKVHISPPIQTTNECHIPSTTSVKALQNRTGFSRNTLIILYLSESTDISYFRKADYKRNKKPPCKIFTCTSVIISYC